MPIGYFVTVLLVVAATTFALWPRPTNGPHATPSFALGTLGNEIPFMLTWYLLFSTWIAWDAGDLDNPVTWPAVGLAALSMIGLAWIAAQSFRASRALDGALTTTLGADRPRTSRLHHRLRAAWAFVAPFRLPNPRIQRLRNLSYGPSARWNRLDVYRRRDVTSGPAFVYFHPGGFHSGSKNQQSKLLLEALAARGWVCVSANYHLRTDYSTTATAVVNRKVVPLTPIEFRLLHSLASQPGIILSDGRLLHDVWGSNQYLGGKNLLKATVYRLRKALVGAGLPADLIQSRRGQGYLLDPDSDA